MLPIDLELHPGLVRAPASHGLVAIVDGTGAALAPPVRVTIATDRSLDCVLAGQIDGPFDQADEFERVVAELRAGRGSAKRLARRVEALVEGGTDPGWSRMPWRRG